MTVRDVTNEEIGTDRRNLMSSNARDAGVEVSMSAADFDFITTYDPDRERSASRRDIALVIEEIQAILLDGLRRG